MRKTYSSEFKAKLVMEVLRGERLLNEIASENNIHPNMLTRWKTDAVNNFHILFENENAKIRKQAKDYEGNLMGQVLLNFYKRKHLNLQINKKDVN